MSEESSRHVLVENIAHLNNDSNSIGQKKTAKQGLEPCLLKRLSLVLMTGIFVFGITACGSSPSEEATEQPIPQISPRPSPSPEPPLLSTSATDPVLFFSDLTSGPKNGNSDTSNDRSGSDGAIVTIWGRNLGALQGGSQVYVNGAPAASYYFWGNATIAADLYTFHEMQRVSFQISHLADDGDGDIHVEVDGHTSNSLPFTVRSGNIYFVATGGDDENGDGSWGKPWRTIQKAADSLAQGDIAYIGDGVNQTTMSAFDAAVNLASDGTASQPKALIVYPGAVSQVGNADLQRAFHVWNGNTSSYSQYWVLSGFNLVTAGVGVSGQTGFRIINNHVSAPNGDGLDGALGGIGNDVFILGNELENVGGANSSKYYHAIYISGIRQDDPPRPPVESNREVAWNYLHDNLSNRAINIYSEQDNSSYIEGHRIHDNVIVNQRGDGIMLGYYVTGDNWIYNNLVINAGLGPDWPDDISFHTGIRINTGHENVAQTTAYIFNNTFYGNGWAGAAIPEESGSLLFDPWGLSHSTIHFSNNLIYSTGEPYLAVESGELPADNYLNCWHGSGDPPSWDMTAIVGDPGFIDPANFNFRLQPDSPCVDTGKDVSQVVRRDFLGAPRPQDSGFDIGVFEYSEQK